MRASDAPGRAVGRLVALAQGKVEAASTMGGAAASQGRRSKMTFLSREQEAEAVVRRVKERVRQETKLPLQYVPRCSCACQHGHGQHMASTQPAW